MIALVEVGSDNRAGQLLASKYRLEELLGSGAMGHVYRATNELVGRPVAIKLLRAEHAANELIVERFLREAKAANLVGRHPNVVDVLDMGKDERGSPFIVQELLHGEDLSQYAKKRGRLTVEEVVDLLCPVIDAVAEAHTNGVVHRDIKPENVFLAKQGGRTVPKLLDFGISKIRATGDVRATEAGVMMGTPAYMPPEQVQGARDADARSDVWALGVMLFELLSGRLPFDQLDAHALFVAIATKDAPRLVDVAGDIPPNVSKIVERCLRRKPDERYPSAAELARDLRLMEEGQELEATGKRSIPPEWKAALGKVPDISIPPSPIAATIATNGAAPPPPSAAKSVKVLAAVPDLEVNPNAPTLDLAALPPGVVPRPEKNPGPPPASAPGSVPIRINTPNAPLQGVMLDPAVTASAAAARRRPAPNEWRPREREQAPPPPDMGWVVSFSAVTLIAIAALGGLMSIAHRPDGWPIARFAVPNNAVAVLAVQSVLALVVALAGGGTARKAFRQWNLDHPGGRSSAAISAAIAGALFFAAIELVRGGW